MLRSVYVRQHSESHRALLRLLQQHCRRIVSPVQFASCSRFHAFFFFFFFSFLVFFKCFPRSNRRLRARTQLQSRPSIKDKNLIFSISPRHQQQHHRHATHTTPTTLTPTPTHNTQHKQHQHTTPTHNTDNTNTQHTTQNTNNANNTNTSAGT